MIESQIDNLLKKDLSDEARATALLGKAILVALNHRLIHINGLTAFAGEIEKLTREVRLLTKQVTYLRGSIGRM